MNDAKLNKRVKSSLNQSQLNDFIDIHSFAYKNSM